MSHNVATWEDFNKAVNVEEVSRLLFAKVLLTQTVQEKKELFARLQGCARLEVLDLFYNRLDHADGQHLSLSFPRLLNLKILDLRLNALELEGCEEVCQGLKNHPSLEELYLGGNGIKEEGAVHVGALLSSLKSLKTLNLSCNPLGAKGVKAIVGGLLGHPTLQSLNLNHTRIEDEGLKAISELIPTLSQLTSLSLFELSYSEKALGCLLRAIVKCKKLDHLAINLTPKLAEFLAGFLRKNKLHRFPKIEEDDIDRDSQNAIIKNVLEENKNGQGCPASSTPKVALRHDFPFDGRSAHIQGMPPKNLDASTPEEKLSVNPSPAAPDEKHGAPLSPHMVVEMNDSVSLQDLIERALDLQGPFIGLHLHKKAFDFWEQYTRLQNAIKRQEGNHEELVAARDVARKGFVETFEKLPTSSHSAVQAGFLLLDQLLKKLTLVEFSRPRSIYSDDGLRFDRLQAFETVSEQACEVIAIFAALKTEIMDSDNLQTSLKLFDFANFFYPFLYNLISISGDLSFSPYLKGEFDKVFPYRDGGSPSIEKLENLTDRIDGIQHNIKELELKKDQAEKKAQKMLRSNSSSSSSSPSPKKEDLPESRPNEVQEIKNEINRKRKEKKTLERERYELFSELRKVTREHFPELQSNAELKRYPGLTDEIELVPRSMFQDVQPLSKESNMMRRHKIEMGKWEGVRCALKEKNDHRGQDDIFKEASILANAKHPFIIQLLCLCIDEDSERPTFALVFPLYDYDLERFMNEHHRTTSPDLRLMILKKVLRAVEYLHEECKPSIVHRDIKPANVFLNHGGLEVVLADCDNSKELIGNTLSVSTFNNDGGLQGTLRFASPEAFARDGEKKPSKDSDMFSFGALTHWIFCTGQLKSEEIPQIYATEVAPSLFKVREFLGEKLCDNASHFVSCALKKERSERPTAKQALIAPLFEAVSLYEMPDEGLPSYFVSRIVKPSSQFLAVDVTAELGSLVEGLMNETRDSSSHGKGKDSHQEVFSTFKVSSVHRVENVDFWRNSFHGARSSLLSRREKIEPDKFCLGDAVTRWPVQTRQSDSGRKLHEYLQVDEKIGEHLLFHGTSGAAVKAIPRFGFDARVGKPNSAPGLFGRGIYFAESASKADQYSRETDGQLCMFLSRVLLGETHKMLHPSSLYELRRPPCKKDCRMPSCECVAPRYDSVVVLSKKQDPMALLERFREFIVYEGRCSYPELLVTYTREK